MLPLIWQSILALSVLAALVACQKGSLSLPPTDDEANTHMVKALDYGNQWIRWMNALSELDRPDSDEWKSHLAVLENAIAESKQVPSDFLQRAHPDLPDMWSGFFIPSMEKIHEYYASAVYHPGSVQLPSTEEGMRQLELLEQGHMLDRIWGDWYDQNRDAIRDGIRSMAK